MRPIKISPSHLYTMQMMVSAFKQIMADTGKTSGEQQSSELCQLFFFDNIGARDIFPVEKRNGMHIFWLSAGSSSLAMAEGLSRIKSDTSESLPANEVIPYLARAFKVAHQTFYPNSQWLNSEVLFKDSQQKEPKSTLAHFVIPSEHLFDFNLVISNFRNSLATLWQTNPNEILNEQFTASMCQLAFYICLDIDSYLPIYQQQAIPRLKSTMQSTIDYMSATMEYMKELIVERGVDSDEITEYFMMLFRHLYAKEFPNAHMMQFA